MAKLHHPHAGLLLIRNKKQLMIPLQKDVTTIGRKQADIILDDPKVSSTHAEIHRTSTGFQLIDLQSTNGTFVNRKQVKTVDLTDQDVIEVGLSTLCYFEDAREYHGTVEDTPLGHKMKIETVSKKVTSVTTTKTLAQLGVEAQIIEGPDAGKKFKFKKSHVTIGRSDADLVLLDLDVSRAHAMIEVLGKSAIYVRDLGSTNGTFLNEKKIQSEKLKSGDEVTVGNTKIRIVFEISSQQGPETSSKEK